MAEPWDINYDGYDHCDGYSVHSECFIKLRLSDNKTEYIGIMSIDADTTPEMVANGFGKLIYSDNRSVLYSKWINGKSVNPRLLVTKGGNEYRNDEILGEVIVAHTTLWSTNNAHTFANQPLPNFPETKKLAVTNNQGYEDRAETNRLESDSNFPPCPADETIVWHNCVGTFTSDKEDVYVGEIKNDKRHGQGKNTWPSGETYVGEWNNGERKQGRDTYADGSVYVGEFKNGKAHGQGTYTYADGHIEAGEWENDNIVTPTVADNQGGYDPKNEQESNNPDVDEKKDPPKTYIAKNENELLPAASGSGFAISKDGHILTNNHVINGCQALNIHTNGKLVSARLIASDPSNDLALIKGDFKPKTVFLLKSATPKLLDEIYVAGYPFGYAISSSIKITNGIISSLSGIGNNFSNMQIDAAIQPGNSGGPVLDKKGNVVGVAVAKLDMEAVYKDYGVIPENINFAIKSSTAKSFAESNNIRLIKKSSYKNKDLGKYISDGTYYLSCMMTMAKIKEMETQKVLFQNIIK